LQISQGYIIRILHHFATKLWNITNFVMLFHAMIEFGLDLLRSKFRFIGEWYRPFVFSFYFRKRFYNKMFYNLFSIFTETIVQNNPRPTDYINVTLHIANNKCKFTMTYLFCEDSPLWINLYFLAFQPWLFIYAFLPIRHYISVNCSLFHFKIGCFFMPFHFLFLDIF
jgi:hypothetical protein